MNMQHRAFAFAAFCLVASATLLGCKSDVVREDYPRTETLYLGGFAEKSTDWPSAESCPLIFETLFRFDETNHSLQPLLALSYSQNTNAVEIKLNPKARFSDGTKVSADDVIFALQNAAPQEDISLGDEGSILISSKDAKRWNPALVKDLLMHVRIKPQHEQTRGTLVGSGPYVVSKIYPNKIIFSLNEHYWAGSTHLPKFIIHSDYNSAQHLQSALARGHLDIAQGLASENGLDLVIAHKRPPWNNTLVRKALLVAIQSTDTIRDSSLFVATRKEISFLLSRSPLDTISKTLLYQGTENQAQVNHICQALAHVGIYLQPQRQDSLTFYAALNHGNYGLAMVERPWDPSPSSHWRRIHQIWINEGTQDSPIDPKVKLHLDTLATDKDSATTARMQEKLETLAKQLVPSVELSTANESTLRISTEHWSMPAHFTKISTSSLQAMQAKRLDLKQ